MGRESSGGGPEGDVAARVLWGAAWRAAGTWAGIESANLTRSGGRSARQQETPTKTNNLTRRQGTRVGIQGHGRQLTLQGKIHQGRKQS